MTWPKPHGRSTPTFGGSTLRGMKSTRNRRLTPSWDVLRMHRTQALDRRRGLDAESDLLPQGLPPTMPEDTEKWFPQTGPTTW